MISAQTLNLHRRAKALFEASRDSLGSRELGKTCANKVLILLAIESSD